MLLVIDRKDTVVRHATGVLCIEAPSEPTRSVPIRLLEQVVVYGNPLIESAVWRSLADAGIPAVLVDVRGKQQTAFMGAGLATTLPLRRMQHRCANDELKQLAIARYCIQQKLASYDLPLLRLQQLHGVTDQRIQGFKQQVAQANDQLSTATSLNSLSGFEGQVAAAWFKLLSEVLKRWKFEGRNRQPPRDPVNALLSLGYTLMLSEVRHALAQAGFDVALGFLHQDYPGRESLPLDVLETFRATVDAFVLEWLHQTPLDQSSFYYREAEGCRLSKATRPAFYASWANLRQHCPRPFKSSSDKDWPYANLTEIINGQVMRLREVVKQLDQQGEIV